MILVTGGNGVVGVPLCQALAEQGLSFLSISRTPSAADGAALRWDLTQPLSSSQRAKLNACDTLVHCAPIWLLPQHLPALSELGIKRLVVFSSTSVTSKQASNEANEQRLVDLLANAEQSAIGFAKQSGLDLTIFRPSMIYGYGRDSNVSHIARRLKKIKVMPIAGKGSGLRQPVHADDLVQAVLASLNNPSTFGQVYTLAGGERLSYRELVTRIFVGLGRRPFIIHLPVSMLRIGLRFASKFSGFAYSAEMADRMNQDMIYDNQRATADFGYKAQKFLEQPARDLPL